MKKNLQLLSLLALLLLGSVSATYAQGSTSAVGTDGFLRVNGQKFFPVGYYTEGFDGYDAHAYAATTLAGAGFNTIYTEHNQITLAEYTTFFNLCNTLGMKNLISFYSEINSTSLDSHKGFPSVLSWSIADDGDARFTAPEVKARHDAVRALDPSHVTSSALTTGIFSDNVKLQQYTAATDVSALEWYPVLWAEAETSDVKFTYQPVSRLVEASAKQGKSGMVILQTYNWKNNYPDSAYVWPSAAQIRTMSYTSLIAGAKGVLFYTFKDYGVNSTVNLTQPAMWNATADFAAKMKNTLTPVVLNGTRSNLVEQSKKPYVHASYWNYNGRQYLIAVNLNQAGTGDDGQRTVSFATSLDGAMTNLFNDYPATLTKTSTGVVSGTMQPLEVQVYEITGSSTIPTPTPTPTPAPGPTTLSAPSGTIVREVWNHVYGNTVSWIPVDTVPDVTGTLTTFEAPSNVDDYYGQRLRGYLTAPTTGPYTFWIAGDNNCELYLSTNDKTGGKTKIAAVTTWTPSRVWDKEPGQKSAAITLQAGEQYYIEALMKEGNYGDHLGVGWSKPGEGTTTPIEIIPGGVLSELPTSTIAPNAPSSLSATVASRSQINLRWTDNSSIESGFRIERSLNGTSWTQIATVTSATYASAGLARNTLYYYRVRAYNSSGSSTFSNTVSARTLR